jgi:hypothetical protein
MNWLFEFKRCEPWISSALQYCGDTHEPEDVLLMVAQGEAQFWPGQRSAVVTTVLHHPRRKELFFWLAGGDLDELQDMYRDIETWGREQGCTLATLAGRRGWERTFLRDEGYTPRWFAASKELSA